MKTLQSTTQFNQREYAKKLGVAQPAVSHRLNKNLSLPGISKIEKFGRFYLLTAIPGFNFKAAKKDFVGVKKRVKHAKKLKALETNKTV